MIVVGLLLGSVAAGGSGLVGKLQEVEDSNGAITRTSYDEFGRPTELRRPGTGFTDPATEIYNYNDTAQPFEISHSLRDDDNDDSHIPMPAI